MSDYELYHYGVLGMKWGVRKSERQLAGIRKKAKRDGWSEDAKSAAEIRTKNPKQMSNAEMRKLNERTQLERNYKQLHPSTISRGFSAVAKAGAIMGTAILVYNNANTLRKIGKPAADKVIDFVGDMVLSDMNAWFWPSQK